jgi:purine-binding chemotaxis protein CheW
MNAENSRLDDEYDDFEEEDAMSNRYLTFHLGNEDYGIEIQYVTEIVGIQHVTEVPDMPEFVCGVINLRGRVIPLIDVRARFHMEAREYDDRTCVIVVQVGDNASIGLVVDRVNEVLDIPEENVSPPPKIGTEGKGQYLHGMGKVGDQVKILLDVNKLLFDEEIERLSA